MKIALFTDSFLPQINGVSAVLGQMINYFNQNNIDYMVFAPEYKGYCEDEGNIQRLSSFRFVFYPESRFALPNYSTIKKQLDIYKPDVIHIMTPFSMGICGLIYAMKHPIPVVATYNTNYAEQIKSYKIPIADSVIWQYLRWFYSRCKTVCCPSSASKTQLDKHGIDNALVFPNGVDIQQFSPVYRNDNWRSEMGVNGKIALLYVGRMSKDKNLSVLMDTMNILNSRGYEQNIRLIMVGDGPIKDKLARHAPENVCFTGYMRTPQLSIVYASSDIFIFPSYIETFGNVALEAMSAGLPVIGAKGSGCMDIIQNGFTGMLCNHWSPVAFADAVETMIKNEQLMQSMAQNARAAAIQYDWDNIMSRYMYLYSIADSLQKELLWKKQTQKLYRLARRSYIKGRRFMERFHFMI
jgi:glycosyltransferase involved in cell wall biosynthesis